MRYLSIMKKLRKSHYATFDEISEFLELESDRYSFELNISKRTFQRDLNEIRTLFNMDIRFDQSKKAYYIDDDEESDANNRMLEAFDMFNSLNMADKVAPYMIFEKRRPQGIENLNGLLHTVKNHLVTGFTYKKFWDDDISQRIVEPLALKESRYRWYLIANDLKDNTVKSFGLDRIFDLEITKKIFDYPANFDANEMFRNCFGIINKPGEDPEKVVISFNVFHGKFVKSFPFHHSQKTIIDDKKEFRIELKINITQDFIMELMSFGDNLKIISPKKLKNEFCKILKNGLEKNK